MAPPDHPKVLFFGVGSVGSVYLYLLSKIASTTAVCRSNYTTVKEKGITLNSTVFGNNLHVFPNVVRSCEEAAAQNAQPFDYVILSCKVTPGVLPALIAPAITPGHTVIALLQNGIGIEEEYAVAFPHNPLLTIATYCATTQRPAGIITHIEVERLEIGSYPSHADNAHAKAFTELVQSAGATATLFDDVQYKRWYKLLLNAAWNPTCALTLCSDVQFMQSSEEAIPFSRSVMMEARAIALAYGYDIPEAEVEAQLERAVQRIAIGRGIEPSMLQDVKEGRTMEVEAILGNSVRMARVKGVKCTRMETLYVMAKALNSQIGR